MCVCALFSLLVFSSVVRFSSLMRGRKSGRRTREGRDAGNTGIRGQWPRMRGYRVNNVFYLCLLF